MRIITILILVFISGAQCCWAAVSDLTESDLVLLKRGDILVQAIHEEKSGGAARVTAVFDTDRNAIWNVIGYCENEFIYVRGLELCEVLEGDRYFLRKHHRVNNNWYTPTIDFTFVASRNSLDHGEFYLVGGDLRVMEGQWVFEAMPDGDSIFVTHEIRIRSKFPAPRWLIRRVLKRDLPNMVACVRGLADASGDSASLARDLERCPGVIAKPVK